MAEEKNKKRNWSKEFTNSELLQMLKDEIIRVGLEDNPSRTELEKRYDKERIPHPNLYIHKFGKWENIMKVIDLNYSSKKNWKEGGKTNKGKRHAATWSDLPEEEVVNAVLEQIKEKDIRTSKEYAERKENAPSIPALTYITGLRWTDVKRIYEQKHGVRIDGSTQSSWVTYSDKELLDIVVDEMRRIDSTRYLDFNSERNKEKAPTAVTLLNRGYSWKDVKEYYNKKYGEENKND